MTGAQAPVEPIPARFEARGRNLQMPLRTLSSPVKPAQPYFANHSRRSRFPWSLYHRELELRLAAAVRELRPEARVLVVGCGLEPFVPGAEGPVYYGADLDPASIAACRARHPEFAARLAVCPDPYELPRDGSFDIAFDAIVAKEVIEHLHEPERWMVTLADRLTTGGELLVTTPNYGTFSTLPLLEATLLELLARRDGYSRKHIHPSRFTRDRLRALSMPGMALIQLESTLTQWALFARWRKVAAT
jgi:SAM-dependent methyltransferase